MQATTEILSPRSLRILRRAIPDYERLRQETEAATMDLYTLFDSIHSHESRIAKDFSVHRLNGGQFLPGTESDATFHDILQQGIDGWTEGFLETVLEWRDSVTDYASGVAKHEMFRKTLPEDSKRSILTHMRGVTVPAYEPGATFMLLAQADIDPRLCGKIEADLRLRSLLQTRFMRHSSGMTPQSSQRWPHYVHASGSNDPLGIYSKTPRPNLAYFSRHDNVGDKIMAQPNPNNFPLEIDGAVGNVLYLDFLAAWKDARKIYEDGILLLRGLPETDALIKRSHLSHGNIFEALHARIPAEEHWSHDAVVTSILARERQLLETRQRPTICATGMLRGMRYAPIDDRVYLSLRDIIRWLFQASIKDVFTPGEIVTNWRRVEREHVEAMAEKKANQAAKRESTRTLNKIQDAIAKIDEEMAHPTSLDLTPAELKMDPERAEILRKRRERRRRKKQENEKVRLQAKKEAIEADELRKSQIATPPKNYEQERFFAKKDAEQKRQKSEAAADRRLQERANRRAEEEKRKEREALRLHAQKAKQEVAKPVPTTKKKRPHRPRQVPVSRKEWLELRAARQWQRRNPYIPSAPK